jgi:hypothetical protein
MLRRLRRRPARRPHPSRRQDFPPERSSGQHANPYRRDRLSSRLPPPEDIAFRPTVLWRRNGHGERRMRRPTTVEVVPVRVAHRDRRRAALGGPGSVPGEGSGFPEKVLADDHHSTLARVAQAGAFRSEDGGSDFGPQRVPDSIEAFIRSRSA